MMNPMVYSMMPAVTMGLLLLAGLLPEGAGGLPPLAVEAITETVVFLLPLAVFGFLGRQSCPLRLRLRFNRFRFIPFVLCASVAVSLFSFFANYVGAGLLAGIFPGAGSGQSLSHYGGVPGWLLALALALLPALVEELFFRGGLLSGLEEWGQPAAILISALCFAMVHGSAVNFLGPLAAGLVFGYLTAVTDSIWPAVAGHLIHNLIFLAMELGLRRYAAFGIWPYFIMVGAVALCVFTYLAAVCLEHLLAAGRIRRLRGGRGLQAALLRALCPGVLAAFALFLVKIVWVR